MVPNLQQVINTIEVIAPKRLAVDGDPVGLQYGDLHQPVNRLMISLDATLKTLAQACNFKADLLVTHHPLLFESLTPRTMSGPLGALMVQAIRNDLAVYSAHTNLDAAPEGINTSMADLLGLRDRCVLEPGGQGLFKLVVFVPVQQLEKVRSAAFNAGAGRIGNYSGCSFHVEGTGTFKPGGRSRPVIGKRGQDEKVKEIRLEVTVRSEALESVLLGVRKAHPYEEPAIDVYPVRSGSEISGLGVSGTLGQRSSVGEVADIVTKALKTSRCSLVGKKSSRVRKVAICAGSGASLLDAAAASGAQLYITGDLKYHEARKAEDMGINVLDVGHFAPEKYGLVNFGDLLDSELANRGFAVEIAHAKESDPFSPVT